MGGGGGAGARGRRGGASSGGDGRGWVQLGGGEGACAQVIKDAEEGPSPGEGAGVGKKEECLGLLVGDRVQILDRVLLLPPEGFYPKTS